MKNSIKKMGTYKPPLEGRSSQGFLLLDFNERTTQVSESVREALVDFIQSPRLQTYPEYGDIEQRLASYAKVSDEQVMVTSGSDQGIDIVFRAFCDSSSEVIIPSPSFAMFYQSAAVEGAEIISPAYTADYQYPLEEVLSSINENTKVIVVCNPNNPTGTVLNVDGVLKIAKAAPQAAILVDECYVEFSGVSVCEYVGEFKNIFVTRTLSKTWGLPSLRFGYLVSDEENIENLKKVRGPYDVSTISVVAARAALENPEYMESYVDEVLNVSKPMLEDFLSSRGIEYWPSAANFILCYPPDGDKLVEDLKEEGILVRPRTGPGIEGSVRISLGTKEQTQRLISVLNETL